MSSLDDVYIEKRLSSVANTQESIQSLSLWALHHKAQHKQIVNIWLQLLKSATLDLRLNLFYLCNEMVQTCKKRNADLFKDSFKGVLGEAVACVRDSPVRLNIERICRIWIERSVYEADFVEDLMTILHNDQPKSPAEVKLLAEFKPEKLFNTITSLTGISQEVEIKRHKLLELLSFNVDETNGLQLRLRDHDIGEEEYSNSLEQKSRHLNEYIASLDSELTQRQLMLQLLELSEIYYDDQYTDALLVAQAYKNFGNRISNLKVKLLECQKFLPDPRPQSPSTTNARVSTDGHSESVSVVKTSDASRSSKNDCASTDGLETFLPKLERGFMTFLPKRIPSLGAQCAAAAGVAAEAMPAPMVAEGDSTPVQDEEPDEPIPFSNPMEFLSQLINRSSSRPPLSTALSVSTDEEDKSGLKTSVGLGLLSLPERSSSLLEISHQMMAVDSNFSLNAEEPIVSSLSTETDVDASADVHSVGPDRCVLQLTGNFIVPDAEMHSRINGNLESIHQPQLISYGHSLCTADYTTVSSTMSHSRTSECYLGNSYNSDISDIVPSVRNHSYVLEDESLNDSPMPLPLDIVNASYDHGVNQRHMGHMSRPSHPYLVSSNRLPLQRPFHPSELNSRSKALQRQQLPQLQLFNRPEAQLERFRFLRPECHRGTLESTDCGSATSLHYQNQSSLAFQFGSVSPISFPLKGHLDSTDSAFQPHLSVNHT